MSMKWQNHKSNSGTVFKNPFHFFNCKKWKQKILVDKTMFCQNHNRLWQINISSKKRLFLKRRYYVFLEPAKLSCLSWIFYWSHRIFGWAVRFLHEVGIILVIEHCPFHMRYNLALHFAKLLLSIRLDIFLLSNLSFFFPFCFSKKQS